MPTNVISGRVVLKETGIGVPDLLVVIHDLDPGTVPEEATGTSRGRGGIAPAAVQPGLGDRLGSRLTDTAGAFTFSFEDEEFQIRNANEKRPDLHLVVLAPEEPGAEPQSRILYTSSELRRDAGRTEQYLIRLPGDVLTRAGVPIPLDPAVARHDARAVVSKVAQAAAWRTELEQETRKLAAARVADAREEARRTDDIVEQRLIESLTGVTAEEAQRLNIVPPGKKTEEVVWATAVRRIEKVNDEPAVTGYLVLTHEEAQRFRDNGGWRTDIAAAEIEPYLYRTHEKEGRPTFITRNDPVEAMCRAASTNDPLAAPGTGSSGSPSSGGGSPNGTSSDPEVTALDLPRFVGRIISGMAPPEDPSSVEGENGLPESNGSLGTRGRPTAADIQRSIAELRIASGPADVTAFHDYHNLQIAFDYVWKQLLDEGVIETGKALARTIADQGGDPLAALASASDPIVALKQETRHIMRTNDRFGTQLPTWVGDLVVDPSLEEPLPPGGGPGGGGPGGGPGAGTGGGGGGPRGPRGLPSGPFANPGSVTTTIAQSPHFLLAELEAMLYEKHKFEVFAPGSVNFGLLVTYRQKWQPITYQAGALVHTLTLAPKETRKVTSRRTVKRDRSVKETESNLRNRTDEMKTTARVDAEVVDRASTKTNFTLNAKGSYNIGIAKGDSTTTLDKTAEASSQETKKSFHESVMSAAMQLRSERGWSFETKDVFEDEITDSSEITNPNDELTATYLFYELERRYLVSESLHRLTPVVLVAMEVPNPGRQPIDRILLKHSWIINRVLLDDRYRAPLEYLCSRIVGDELALKHMSDNLEAVRASVEQLKKMHRDVVVFKNLREEWHTAAVKRRADKVAGQNTEGWAESALEVVTGSGDEEDVESARILEDLNRELFERTVREEKDIRMRLEAETAALTATSDAYAKAAAEHTNRLMEVNGLRVHFKENVLYYMQAIWSFTFEDQIFFSLCNVKAPVLTDTAKTYGVTEAVDPPLSVAAHPDRVVLEVRAKVTLKPEISVEKDATTLVQIADLDRPLGFKGNYMIFPLRKSNPLTDLMMVPYVDTELGLHDPDELGAWAPADFAHYARCLLEVHRQRDDLTEAEFAALEHRLRDQYTRIVSSPRRVSDEIIVPTDSLFIEALPGAHALLEDFKLQHRRMDVEKVREETRKLKLESLRYAARILDKSFEDPDIERKIVINGASNGIVVPADQ